MTYDASNRKDIRRAEKAEFEAERERIEFLRAAMSTRQGRAWFHAFLSECHLFSDPFTGNALHEAYLKGERNVGLRQFAMISAHTPDHYITMMKEENARIALTAARDVAATAGSVPAVAAPREPDFFAADPYAEPGADGE